MTFITFNYWLVINLVASMLLFTHCLWRLNLMSHRCNHAVRIFYVALAVGAAGVLLGPFYGYLRPQPAEVISNIGAAGLFWGGWMYRSRRASDKQEES